MTDSERIAWLEERRKGLGATDIASLAGVGFSTPGEVFLSKIDPAAARDVHPLLKIGLATENLNAELYGRRMGIAVHKPETAISRHVVHPWACASLDRVTEDLKPLELKYTPFFGDRWGEEFTEQIPDAYLVQTQWQMLVAGGDVADVSVLSGSGDHRVYRVPRSESLIGLLLELGRRFWVDHVCESIGPPEDWCAQYAGKLEETCAAINDAIQPVLGEDAIAAAEEYTRAKSVVKEAEALADAAKERLLGLMGEAGKALAGPYVLTRSLVEGGKEVAYVTKPYVRFMLREPKPKKTKVIS